MLSLNEYFNALPTNLVYEASNKILKIKVEELIKRFNETFDVDTNLKKYLEKLLELNDSPKLRFWLSVSEDMLRSHYKVIDNHPRFISHFFADSLDASRIVELHILLAIEIFFDAIIEENETFDFSFNDIQFPRYWNIKGFGTLEVFKKSIGIILSFYNKKIKLSSENFSFEIDILTHEYEVKGSMIFHLEKTLKNEKLTSFIPYHTNGIATSYHSNCPIIRSDESIDEWLKYTLKSIEILNSINNEVANDCLKLSPYILPLHANLTSYGSSSPMEIIGLIFIPGVRDEYDIAECLLHEAMHQKLFRAEEGSTVFINDNEEEIYYSPWRSDPRPLRMLIHGAYVFTGVSLMWYELSKKFENSLEKYENALFHCYYRAVQAKKAMDVLEKYGELSSFGIKLVNLINYNLLNIFKLEFSSSILEESQNRTKTHFENYQDYKH